MNGNRQYGRAALRQRLLVERDVRLEPTRISADDRERQRKLVTRRANDGLGTSADADPRPESVVGPGKDFLALERRTRRAVPVHWLTRVIVPQQRREEIELVLEEDFVFR